MAYVGTWDCYKNIKMKPWFTISILKPQHIEIFRSSTMFCKMLHTWCYWGISYITFSAEHISHMPRMYSQGCISPEPAGNIISWKGSVASINRTGESEPFRRGFRGQRSLRKFLGSREYLDQLNNTGKTLFYSIKW